MTPEQVAPLITALRPITSRVPKTKTAMKIPGQKGSTWRHDEPLTRTRLAAHLNGGPYRGVCPIAEGESTTMVAVIDFDAHKGESTWDEMSSAVIWIAEGLSILGASPSLFRSTGGSGVHLYLFWESPQDARSVRMWLKSFLLDCGFKIGTGGVKARQVEVFPKQDKVDIGRCGSQFIIALAGDSVPLTAVDGLLVPQTKESLSSGAWAEMSCPVPVAPVQEARAVAALQTVETAEIRRNCDWIASRFEIEPEAAMAALSDGASDGWRGVWRDILFTIHTGTGASEEGREIAHALSERLPDYGGPDPIDHIWDHADATRGDGLTVKSLAFYARKLGIPPADDFSVVAANGGARGSGDGLGSGGDLPDPAYARHTNGDIKAEMRNAVMTLRRPDLCGFRLAHDLFRDEMTVASPDTEQWRAMTDADISRLRIRMEDSRYKSVSKELVRDAAVLVADENQHDTAQIWLAGLESAWDGLRRVETFLIDRFGCEDTPYVRAVSRYLWTAMAGRVMSPGCQVDMCMVLEGDQGLRKTSSIKAMVPGEEHYMIVNFEENEETTARKMRGVLVGEIAELRGLGTKDEDAIKLFMTQRHEKWIPKYKEFSTTFPRRLVFIGTLNLKTVGFLTDETGNRRWLPVHVERADVEGIERDRDQLWAEGARMWRAAGVHWREVEMLSAPEHLKYLAEDAWEEAILRWLTVGDEFQTEGGGGHRGGATIAQIAGGAVGIGLKEITKAVQMRIGAVLKKIGWQKGFMKVDGVTTKAWFPPPK